MYSVINTTDETQTVDAGNGRTRLEPGERDDFERVMNGEELVEAGLIVRTRGGYLQPDGIVTDTLNQGNIGQTDRDYLEQLEFEELQSVAALNDVKAVGIRKDQMIDRLLQKDDIQLEEE